MKIFLFIKCKPIHLTYCVREKIGCISLSVPVTGIFFSIIKANEFARI